MNIQKGMVVQYSRNNGSPVSALVDSAINFGSETSPDWYICGSRTDNERRIYVKQSLDGITIHKAYFPQ